MSAAGTDRTTITTLLTNVVIAVAKFIAWAMSGSFSLLAEGVHSLALSGKQLLQVMSGRDASSSGGSHDHDQFAHARSRAIYAYVAAIVLYALGGAFAVYAGIVKLQHPEPVTMWLLPLAVLVVVIAVKCFSLLSALKHTGPVAGLRNRSSLREPLVPGTPAVRLSEPGELVGLLIALIGVSLTALTGLSVFDGVATLLIGVLLVGVALLTGFDIKRLLIGEGASAADVRKIEAALLEGKEIERIIHMSVYSVSPDALVVGAKISLPATTTMSEVSVIVNLAERRIREAVPAAQTIYIEPDVWLDPTLPTPTTSSIVMLSSD